MHIELQRDKMLPRRELSEQSGGAGREQRQPDDTGLGQELTTRAFGGLHYSVFYAHLNMSLMKGKF